MIRQLAWLLVACTATPSPRSSISNHVPGPATRAASSSSCRAVVDKHYDSGNHTYRDPKTGGLIVVTESDVCGLMLEPIFFARDSTSFDPRAADELAGMLACLDQTEHQRMRLEVVGHATSDERQPDVLALRRADAVARYLTACGVPVLGLTTRAEPPGTQDRDRRVDFLIVERSRR